MTKKTQFQNTILLLLLCKFQVLDQHWTKVSRAEERERERETSPKSVLFKTRSPNAFGCCYDPSWRTPRIFYRSSKEGGSMQTEREGNRNAQPAAARRCWGTPAHSVNTTVAGNNSGPICAMRERGSLQGQNQTQLCTGSQQRKVYVKTAYFVCTFIFSK